MSKRAFTSPEELAKLVDEYFDQCAATRDTRQLKSGDIRVRQNLPSIVGLAVYLGIAKSTLLLYAEGKYDIDTTKGDNSNGCGDIQNYSTVLARARDRIELETLNAASNGDTDSRITLARLAKFGYSTKVETESKTELTVKWEGVDTSDIEAWEVTPQPHAANAPDCLGKSVLVQIVAPTHAPSTGKSEAVASRADGHMRRGRVAFFLRDKIQNGSQKPGALPPMSGTPAATTHTYISERGEIYPLLSVCQKSGKTQLNNTKHNH